MTKLNDGDVVVTNEQIVEYLKAKDPLAVKLAHEYNTFINDLDVLKDDSRLERVIKAFDKPDLEERIDSQLDTLVTREFRAAAAEAAETEGVEYVPVTRAAIDAEVALRKNKRLAEIKKKQVAKVSKARNAILASAE
jgi:hypothetical protein